MQTVRFPGLELQLGGTLTVTSERTRPGETEITGTAPTSDRASLRTQLAAAGFTILEDRGASGTFSLLATRGPETVMINAAAPWQMFYATWTNRGEMVPVHVVDGYFAWDGTSWPAFFERGILEGEHDDSLAIAARVRPGAVEAYRAWAATHGYEIEDPLNAWEDEPDLGVVDGLRFRNARHTARLEINGDDLTLFLSLAPGT